MSMVLGLGAGDIRDSYGFVPIYQAIISKVGAEILGHEVSLVSSTVVGLLWTCSCILSSGRG